VLDVIGAAPHGDARFIDAFGIAGSGKTEFIRHVQAVAAEKHGIAAVPLCVDILSAPTNLQDAYNTFVDHVRRLAERLSASAGRLSLLGEFENELATIEQKWMQVEVHNTVNAQSALIRNATVGSPTVDLGGLEGGIYGAKRRAIVSAFPNRFRVLFKRKPLVVTVDGYDAVAGKPVGEWLLDLLHRLPNTLVVLARSPIVSAPPVAKDTMLPAELTLFTRDEVAELLAKYFGREPDDSLVDVVYAWSEGHPGTAAIAAKFACSLDDRQAATLEARLSAPPEDVRQERARLALEFVSTLGGEDLARIATASAVLRVFDEELLAALLDTALPEGAVDRLCVAGIVERVGDADSGLFRVHGFIRESLLELASYATRKKLHRRAASQYLELLSEEESELGDEARPYESWYRYEKPEWQAKLREWLYHQREAAQTEKEILRARLQFVRIFLDAFWWWGCYIDFPFCRDLITDWERARGDDAEWLDDLRLFLDAYPVGWRKQGASGWTDVEAALIGVREECGIDGRPDALSGPEARHTRGLVDNFMAHSCRYRDAADDAARRRQYERACGYYAEAAMLFEKGREEWELAWTLFETAELHADYGEYATAREGWRAAVSATLGQDDFELTANLHRLCADIRWHDGATAEAFAAHARAVLHAYLFQSKTPSHRPDAYTVAFYFEHIERTFERLRELDAAALAAGVETLREPFSTTVSAGEVSSLLASGDPRALTGSLFPAGPREDELLSARSAFTRAIDLLDEQLGDVNRDLAGLEP
jgi:hypothetical protein